MSLKIFGRIITDSSKVPSLPGFPHPGKNLPSLSNLISLKSFNVTSEPDTLNLHAVASLINPTNSDFNLTVPSLPFEISVPSIPDVFPPVPIASVRNDALSNLTHPNITLVIAGSVLPISTSSFPSISNFVTRYLSGLANEISISSPLLPGYDLQAEFPAPNPKPQILRDVTIKDMKIRPSGTLFLASGIVQGHLVLPAGMHVGLDVTRVLPDVLIFDGQVPPSTDDMNITTGWTPRQTKIKKGRRGDPDLPEEPPLPNPLPEHAFGHIRPDSWLPAMSVEKDPGDAEGSVYAISAKVVDVPVEVLPGRQKEFSSFVGKVRTFSPLSTFAHELTDVICVGHLRL